MENDIRRAWLDEEDADLSPGRLAKHRLTEQQRTTPLYTKISYEAGFSRREGRKIYGWGRCYANGELTAEAEGIFVVPLWGAVDHG